MMTTTKVSSSATPLCPTCYKRRGEFVEMELRVADYWQWCYGRAPVLDDRHAYWCCPVCDADKPYTTTNPTNRRRGVGHGLS